MNHLEAVTHAHEVYTTRDTLTREEKIEQARRLAKFGVYSNRQIATFTGLRPALVNTINEKRDKSGGNLEPESLPFIARIIQGEKTPDMIATALAAGAGPTMLARLSGLSGSMIARWGAMGEVQQVA